MGETTELRPPADSTAKPSYRLRPMKLPRFALFLPRIASPEIRRGTLAVEQRWCGQGETMTR